MGRHKAHDKPQVFDVSKPGKSAPTPTSRPVIVNQGSPADDPMVTGNDSSALMSHSAKPVVPIHVDSHETGPQPFQSETPAVEGKVPDANDFGSYPVSSENNEPQQSTTGNATGAAETSSFAEQETASAHESTPTTDNQSENQPESSSLPAELVAPGADDPVGLSSFALPSPPTPAVLPDNTAESQPAPTEPHDVPHDTTEEAVQQTLPKAESQLPTVPENIGEIERLPELEHAVYGNYVEEGKRRLWLVPALATIVLAVFLVLDTGIVGSGKLPFEVFKEPEEVPEAQVAATPASNKPNPANSQTEPKTPLGFSHHSLDGTPLSFSYPTVWGSPQTSKDEGFSKRGGSSSSDGTYSYLITFESNKDVQLALTSNKYLPPKREAQYYDFLQWCIGTHDGKIYRQKLLFSTASNVDTPTTISCSDGPIADATKIDEVTIVQLNTKDGSGKAIGDVYTKNLLSGGEFVVLRAKDTTMSHGDNLKQLLSSAKLSGTN